MTPPLIRTPASFKVTKTVLGKLFVKFKCPSCRVPLNAKFNEAGSTDTCPDCGTQFIVPGADALAKARKQQAEEKAKAMEEQEAREAEKPRIRQAIAKEEEFRAEQTKAANSHEANNEMLPGEDYSPDLNHSGPPELPQGFDADTTPTLPHQPIPGKSKPGKSKPGKSNYRPNVNNILKISGGATCGAGLPLLLYFGLGYDTTNRGMHNIGLQQNRLIGFIFAMGVMHIGIGLLLYWVHRVFPPNSEGSDEP